MTRMRAKAPPCLLCGWQDLEICFEGIEATWATSDCKPWIGPASTVVCKRCAHVQKLVNRLFEDQVADIYAQYDLYHLSDGSEQLVFQNTAGQPQSRSEKILEWLSATVQMPQVGSLLDVGCGNGATLRAFGEKYRRWKMFGFEMDSRCRDEVEQLPGVAGFYSGCLDSIDQKFDLITLVHVLEHLSQPFETLSELRALLKPNGTLLIQVPNLLENPFDLVVFDHYSHFVPETLECFSLRSGYKAVLMSKECIGKEITLLLRIGEERNTRWYGEVPVDDLATRYGVQVNWLNQLARYAASFGGTSRFGIFGTAIAGTWLAATLAEKVEFFVDEDPSRRGKYHLGKPVVHPTDLTAKDQVFLAFPAEIAGRLHARLSRSYPASFVLPPPLQADLCVNHETGF